MLNEDRQSFLAKICDRYVKGAILMDVHHPCLSERRLVVKRHELAPHPVNPPRVTLTQSTEPTIVRLDALDRVDIEGRLNDGNWRWSTKNTFA